MAIVIMHSGKLIMHAEFTILHNLTSFKNSFMSFSLEFHDILLGKLYLVAHSHRP